MGEWCATTWGSLGPQIWVPVARGASLEGMQGAALAAKPLLCFPVSSAKLSRGLSTWEVRTPLPPDDCDWEGMGLTVPGTGALGGSKCHLACCFGPGWGGHRTQASRAFGAPLRIQLHDPSHHELSSFSMAVTSRQEPWIVTWDLICQAESLGAPWPCHCQPHSGPRSNSTLGPLILTLGNQSARKGFRVLSR